MTNPNTPTPPPGPTNPAAPPTPLSPLSPLSPAEALRQLRREWAATTDPALRWEITQLGRAVLLIDDVFHGGEGPGGSGD